MRAHSIADDRPRPADEKTEHTRRWFLVALAIFLTCSGASVARSAGEPYRSVEPTSGAPSQADVRDVINVVDKGADPTGRMDSAPAFRAALGSDRIIRVPPGTYLFNSTEPAPCCAHNPTAVLVRGLENFAIDGYGAKIVLGDPIAASTALHFHQDTNFVVRGLDIHGTRAGVNPEFENVGIALSSVVRFRIEDITISGNFGDNGAGIAGDWMVDGFFNNIAMEAVGQCADVAFLQNVTFARLRANGAGHDGPSLANSSGRKCFSIINDTPNKATNRTGVAFAETNAVRITDSSVTNFATGAYVASGSDIVFMRNRWYRNDGLARSPGIGILITFAGSGKFSSAGVPPRNIVIIGDVFVENGSNRPGYAIRINSKPIRNDDTIGTVTIENCVFKDNTRVAISSAIASKVSKLIIKGNEFSGNKQSINIDDNAKTLVASSVGE